MAENTERTNHPWNALTTVTTFDQGSNMTSTFCLNTNTESSNSGQITRVNPSSGILIESLVKQICYILEKDKTRRNKLYYALCDELYKLQLIDNSYKRIEMLSNKYQRALYQLIKMLQSANGNENLYPLSSLSDLSRYHREFIEITFIASGGFGEVYKAQHRLDGIDYAVKKISVPSSQADTLKQHLNEVKTLAKLNHVNIVSYKAAWIEIATIEVPSLICHSPITARKSHKSRLDSSDYTEESKSYNLESTKDSFNKGKRIIEESTIAEHIEDTNSDIVSFRNSKNQTEDNSTDHNSTDHNLYDKATSQEVCTYIPNENHQCMILYIQMSLCEQTLDQWMRGRINATPEPMIEAILEQILCGIDYIHSQDVVHHDIKPRNIFISTSGQLQIQLGDFGLACPLKSQGKNHSACGTHMYAAPEQLQGKCDSKSDIYSVGIVLIELLIPTQTQMELSAIIRCLKYGNIPKNLPAERHKWAQMIIQMVQEDPVKRPCTKQLLENLKRNEDVTITELKDTVVILKNDIRDKNNKIQKLEETLALLKKEVKKLKNPSEHNS
ncbi:eukaryotic translation initiation factor 2-alpha kinase 1 isoform X2 [Anoplolepis gracilipes]|uniref:eukaryotic translation initiation factor 2-alpha kinase 1 isoform X2 n=1 Tax=Anoplolepis gracilipes TaxID=354296 RepID=UPI003B9FDA51